MMGGSEIGLVARARGLATHLVARPTLEMLADANSVESFTNHLSRLHAVIDPITDPGDVFAVEGAVRDAAARHLVTLRRWRNRAPNALDVFAADQDRRSLRALLRGAAEGAPFERRVAGLLPTPSLPHEALMKLGRCATPLDVVRHLLDLGHDAKRLLETIRQSPADLLSMEIELLRAFADRVVRIAARGDYVLRGFVDSVIDVANAQHALLLAGEPRDLQAGDLFVGGGRWLSVTAFESVVAAPSEAALAALAAAVARSPLASWLPIVTGDLAHFDRAFLIGSLAQLTRAMRLDPLSSAAVLRVLLLIDAQGRDLRALLWGAALGTPAAMRRQQLVTPA